MPYIKILIKEELKFSKKNDLVNSKTKIIRSLEKEFKFLLQKLVSKNKINLYNIWQW